MISGKANNSCKLSKKKKKVVLCTATLPEVLEITIKVHWLLFS